ncbi:MAG TPA: fused MFS/spermidine synthase [Gemmatimonadaceae bacterium]|nr:fused MFS/spermidine synthase [Gemmatimonadaceae bacterium]
MLFALYALFFLSGAAGLMYESIWTRYLALLVGHSAYAQILVLTIFLGGMAVGSYLVGRYTERLRNPLTWYAGVEIAIGVLGLLFHPVFRAVSGAAYDSIFPSLVASPGAQITVKWALAALLILPQSILLGATFPLISAGILRRWNVRPGAILSWLYASNSFGAAVGVLVAGFYLVSRFDFPGTLIFAAILNFIAAGITLALVVQWKELLPTPAHVERSRETAAPRRKWLLLGAAFGTAVASFAYEIAWIRMLSLVLGSATHSFELMLSAFILGLALGALWVSKRADRWQDPMRALGLVQCAMGALAVATMPLYIASFSWISDLIDVFAKTSPGYAGFTIARYGICLAIMLPATFCAGMTLPLITRILYRNGADESAIGEVYASNTAGSIVGVQLAGLLLLPLLGVKFLLVAGAALDVVVGLVLLSVGIPRNGSSRTRVLAAAGIGSLAVLVAASTVRFDRTLLGSGVYRFGGLPAPGEFVTTFYKDGRTATVTVKRTSDGILVLSTNGKPDASVSAEWLAPKPAAKKRPLRDDVSTQILLPLIAMAHAPQAKSAAVIGQGSGMTSHFLLANPNLRELSTIEIEPEMIRASNAFRPVNRRVFTDPRARFIIDDARSYFAGAGRRFDLIVSEPSNPWVSGVAGLFTTEFYARIKRYLADGGVFAQWMHLYEMNDSLVLSMLSAVQENFAAYDIYLTDDSDIVVIATTASLVPTPDWGVTEWPMMAEDLKRVSALTPASLNSLHLADSRTLAPLVTRVRPNSDFAPVLDLNGERARYLLTDASGFENLNASPFDITAALAGRGMPLASDPEALANVPRLQMRAHSARLRLFAGDTSTDDADYAAIEQVRNLFDSQISANIPPAHWHRWVSLLYEVNRDVHGGSPGSIDSAFFKRVDAYVDRVNAPAAVRQAVDFVKAADSWDFAMLQAAGDQLIKKMRKGDWWVPPGYLRDATVVAHLRNGDPGGAKAALAAMMPFVGRDAVGDLRTRLLGAHIAAARAQR